VHLSIIGTYYDQTTLANGDTKVETKTFDLSAWSQQARKETPGFGNLVYNSDLEHSAADYDDIMKNWRNNGPKTVALIPIDTSNYSASAQEFMNAAQEVAGLYNNQTTYTADINSNSFIATVLNLMHIPMPDLPFGMWAQGAENNNLFNQPVRFPPSYNKKKMSGTSTNTIAFSGENSSCQIMHNGPLGG
jgi:hypothetical protein